MSSSPAFRQQSQNKIHSDYMRMKNEHNKMPGDLKTSKHLYAPHLSKRDVENQDPGSSEKGQKSLARLGISRLPVLAKSLNLQTPSDFTQSHKRWEEKPLAGKAKKKKPCTKPVPFNLSQPKSTRSGTQNQKPPTVPLSRTGTRAIQLENTLRTTHPKTKNTNETQSNCPAIRTQSNGHSTQGTTRSEGNQPSSDVSVMSHVPNRIAKVADNTFHASGQPFTSSATLSCPLSSIPKNSAMHQNSVTSLVQPSLSAEACLDNMDLLSLKDPSKTCHASQTVQATPCVNLSKSSAGKGEAFQSDHAALLSILQNKGVSAMESATPQSTKPYNYLPQRVSVMKSRQKAGPAAGPTKSVQFSPDPAALRSIFQNEGLKAGGPLGGTPRNTVCPSGRGTSCYTAQRVPVTKSHAESTEGTMAMALQETPVMKWTPQRVPDTRHQPMSSMASIHKRLLSAHRTPYAGSARLGAPQGCNAELQLHKEEVVQRLFDDGDDEQSTDVTDEDPGTQAEQLPVQASPTESRCEQTGEVSGTHGDEDEKEAQEQRSVGGQPFFPPPHRESVIFFSTGKKLFRAAREKQECSARLEQHGTVSSAQRTVLPINEETQCGSDPTRQINPSVLSLSRDLIVQKSYAKSPAVALLRRRLPPLEELRLDEEVATYTSVPAPVTPAFKPPRPRCGNPLATVLHFQESTRFTPIGYDPSSGPASCSSPLWER